MEEHEEPDYPDWMESESDPVEEARITAENWRKLEEGLQKERPDLQFTFNRQCRYEARWTFPGAVVGGSAIWDEAEERICYGMAAVDCEAWNAYERACGRVPR